MNLGTSTNLHKKIENKYFRDKTGQSWISITINKLYFKTAKAYSRRGFKWNL